MAEIKLQRRYKDGFTPGVFSLEGTTFYTIERPWIPSPEHRGGLNKESCIPEGEYEVRPYNSTRFPNVWYVSNPDLDVHLWAPEGVKGRSTILIHAGNKVTDVIGCIAVGLATVPDRRIVLRSREAIELLRKILGKSTHKLIVGDINGSLDHQSSNLKDSGAGGPDPNGSSQELRS